MGAHLEKIHRHRAYLIRDDGAQALHIALRVHINAERRVGGAGTDSEGICDYA